MTPKELENKIFCFKDDKHKKRNLSKLLKNIVKGLSYVNFKDEDYLPTY